MTDLIPVTVYVTNDELKKIHAAQDGPRAYKARRSISNAVRLMLGWPEHLRGKRTTAIASPPAPDRPDTAPLATVATVGPLHAREAVEQDIRDTLSEVLSDSVHELKYETVAD